MHHPAPLVLTVDDNAAGRYFKTRVLREAGYRTLEAETGEEGLALTGSHLPQIILLDVRLPDLDGLEVCEAIKKNYPGIPVLQMSATFIELADRIRGLERGADAYLVEPVEPQELIATVRSLLRVRKAEHDLREALEQNRLLLDELQHRIKNSLQLVSSVLSLEAAKIKDLEARSHFSTARNRIAVVAKLYDVLYRETAANQVDTAQFLADVVESSRALTESVELAFQADNVIIGVDRAIPLGLIAQELVVNALKHAFPDDRSGRVSVLLTRQGDQYRLEVADDGVGFTPSKQAEGSGSRLAAALAKQLGGSLRHSGGPERVGTIAVVEFPVAP